MKIKIYHGSINKIEKPIYGMGKKYNDYGIGFYCTKSKDMAMEWATSIDYDGYANCYELDLDNLKILDLNNENFCILHWLAILLENREFDISSPLAFEAKDYIIKNFKSNYENYDLIQGYRADDSYFSFAQDFINGTISYRQLSKSMYLGQLGQQIVLKSKKAFNQIKFIDSEIALRNKWYELKVARNNKARREYFDDVRNKRQKGDLYITKILDEEIKEDDLRLRQNLS
ncbi:MAG: DUF3990 domain-containing protein [Alphaproteobacteria bacterium]|nr:DUF3990 domain-containing protein [Alphaproteobacteria bacterium]